MCISNNLIIKNLFDTWITKNTMKRVKIKINCKGIE